jgi:hypothetical protein
MNDLQTRLEEMNERMIELELQLEQLHEILIQVIDEAEAAEDGE